MFVDADDPVKFSLLTLTNDGAAVRRLSLFAYNDWALGPPRESQTGQIITTLRRDQRDHPRAKRLQRRVRRPRRVRVRERDAALRHGQPSRRSSAATDRCRAPAALGHMALEPEFGAGLDPCARPARRRSTLEPGRAPPCAVPARPGRGCGSRRRARRPSRARSTAPRPRWREVRRTLEPDARGDPGPHAGRFLRRADQPVAALSGPELPAVDARRLLPAGRRVRLSRSAAGRHGAAADAAGPRAGASAARGRPAVRRRRRPALVARAERPRPAVALLGRSAVAAVRGGRVRPHDRRRGRSRRARAVPRGAAARAGARRTRTASRARRPRTARCSSTACARSTRG